VKIGLLGGTFNPPHIAHLVCAAEAHDQLGLDRVLLVPTARPPHKDVPDDPGSDHRARMCELAVAGDDRLGVSRIELERPGPSYTVDTLKALHERTPEDNLTFIVGGDMAHSLPTWHDPEGILRLARIAVAERAEVRRADIAERLTGLAGDDRVAFFDMPRIDVASSDLRRRVAVGRPIRYLVPDPVVSYIEQEGLYR
jgi:nicotinate-nucleotide adenylyltransferase